MTTRNHLNDFIEIDRKTQNDFQKTADELLEVEHLDLDNTEYLAKILFCLGRYDESIAQFERIITEKSDDEESLANIAICHFKNNDYKTALTYFKRALRKNPESEMVLSYIMLSCEFLGDFEGAIKSGEQILKINSKNTQAANRLVECHFEVKNFDKCLFYINRIPHFDNYRKAEILLECGKYDECVEALRNVKTAESYYLTSKAYLEAGNTVKAVKYLYKSYEKDLNIAKLFEISDIYFEVEEYKKAIFFLKQALLHDDSNAETYSRIARAYVESGNWDEAIEYGEKALEISKKVPQAYITLSEAHIQLDMFDFTKSKEIIERGLRENPDSAELWAEKGDLNYSDNLIEFTRSYQKALDLKPKDFKLRLTYTRLLIMAGLDEMAKISYNELLLINPLFDKSFDEVENYY